jgi:S-DNA-T family DNA segregation ATPase FtsK/SpoIIIE
MATKTNRKKPNNPKRKDTKKNVKKRGAKPGSFLQSDKFKLGLGVFFLLLSIYLAVTFTSYLFHWTTDYDKVYTFQWSDLSGTVPIKNFGGFIGAWISHVFIYKAFGVPSYLFVLLFFILGTRLSLKVRLLPLRKTFKISFLAMIWLSIFFGSVLRQSDWGIVGGTFGYQISTWLEGITGLLGLVFILCFTFILFLIVQFNLKIATLKKWQKQITFGKRDQINTNQKEDKYNTGEYAVDDAESINEFQTNTYLNDLENNENGNDLTNKNQLKDQNAAKNTDDDIALELTSDDYKETNDNADKKVTENLNNTDELEVKVGEDEQADKDKMHGIDTTYDPKEDLSDFKFPHIDLLESYGTDKINIYKEELEANKNKIVSTLNNYNIKIQKIKATVGATVTLYEIVPAPGIRISKIRNLEDDIALSLSALGIRIIAPIPGKGSIGIEVPNSKPEIVPMRSVIQSKVYQESKFELPVVMGKTISNESFAFDLTKMPHLLMAGATGQGKSVGLNAIIASLLYKKHPAQLKFIMVDPKKVELTLFSKIERHYLAKLPDSEEAIITDTQAVVHTLFSLVKEMDNRYDFLKDAQVRNIKEYNAKFISRRLNPNKGHKYMPYIVLIVDEFADLMMTAGKEVEGPIARLAQLARAVGIHLIIATQRPSVNVITGLIKANFPARLAFRVTSRIDSRTILDAGGADQLIGRGDMLFSTGNDIVRLQCAFIDTPEVDRITEFIGSQRGYTSAFILPESENEMGEQDTDLNPSERDELFEDAARVIVNAQQGSTSLIQRKLKLGYNRAGRIIDQLEAAGIVGPFEGSKAREVRVANEMALEQFLKDLYAREQG